MSDNEYNILFGEKDDKRINLFLHMVEKIVDEKNGGSTPGRIEDFSKTNSVFTLYRTNSFVAIKLPKFMQAGLFKDFVAGNSKDHFLIHKEWVQTFVDILLYIQSDKNMTERLKLIQNIKKLNPNKK